jgi:hypothetical protein
MALPSVSQVTVPVALQNLTIQYKPDSLIGERVFPIFPLSSACQKVLKYSKSNMFRIEDGTLYRAEGGETKIFNWDILTQTVNPRQISAAESVPVEMIDIENMPGQLPTNSIVDAVQHAYSRIDQFKEKLISDTIYGNAWLDGVIGGSAPSTSAGWGLATTGNTFINDVFTQKAAILNSTGVRPNVLVMDYSTFVAQQFNPNLSDKIKYTQRSVVTADLIAAVLELDEVIVGASVYTSSKETKNATTAKFPTMTPIWNPSGKGNAFLFHKEAPGLRCLTAGLQFRLPYRGSMRYVEGYYDYTRRSYVYSVTEQIEIAPLATDIGYAWRNCITA